MLMPMWVVLPIIVFAMVATAVLYAVTEELWTISVMSLMCIGLVGRDG